MLARNAESLYWIGIYFQWIDPDGLAMVPQAFGKGPLGKLAFEVYRRRIQRETHEETLPRRHGEATRGQAVTDALYSQLVKPGRHVSHHEPPILVGQRAALRGTHDHVSGADGSPCRTIGDPAADERRCIRDA